MGAALSIGLLASPQALAANVVDVLVLYTPQALQTRNGADINARIASYIAYTNQAYVNSKVDIQLRVVGAEMINAPYTNVTSNNLQQLRQNATVAQLRRKYGADIVTLLNLRQGTGTGYVCGVGYIPSGDGRTGRFYNNAAAAGFNLVGIDCGVSTFAHEVGHNMGLGHSYAQGTGGGLWPWARGHGVQGLFATVMAYPQSYGTRNQLPVFSNPRLTSCQGMACGVDASRRDGADSATNLNQLASQIAAFMPTVATVDNGDSGSAPPSCGKSEVSGNLLENGEFNSLGGWSSALGASRLALLSYANGTCTDSALLVTNRSQSYGDAYQRLTGKLKEGGRYRLSAKFGIRGGTRDNIRIALSVQDASGSRYIYLDPVSVTANELTAVTRDFTLDSNAVTGLLIYGPQAGVDIIADSVSLVEVAAPRPTAPSPTPVINEQFELSANGWQAAFGGTLSYSYTAAQGRFSLRTSRRTGKTSGPSLDVAGSLQSGERYHLSTSVRVSGAAGSQDTVQVWLYYVDNRGGQWMSLGGTSVAANTWQSLTDEFAINAEGPITSARLLFLGPDRSRDIFIDNLVVERR